MPLRDTQAIFYGFFDNINQVNQLHDEIVEKWYLLIEFPCVPQQFVYI